MVEAAAKDTRSARLADVMVLTGLAILVFAPFLLRVFQGLSALSLPLNHDIALQWIPFRAFISRSFDAGYFPLWSSQVFTGFPFAAFSHTGVFYPLSILLDGNSYARSVNFFYPVHIFIAASGAYFLARRAGISAFPAFFAAASYSFTGKPFYFIHFLPSAMSNPWAPWFLFSVIGIFRRPARRDFLLAAAFAAMQILGGDVESTSYAMLIGLPAAYVLAGEKQAWKRLPALAAALFLAALFSAVTLLPLGEYAVHFARNQGVTFAYFSQRDVPLSLIFSVLLPLPPAASGKTLGMDGPFFHLGLIMIAFALFAALVRARRSSRSISALGVFAVLWAMGSISLLNRLQFSLPVIKSMGSPEHVFFMGQLLLSLAAAQGLSRLLEAKRARIAAYSLAAIHLVMIYALAVIYLPANPPALYDQPAWLADLGKKIKAANLRSIMVTREGPLDPELLLHAGLSLDFPQIDGWITVPPRRYLELLSRADPRAARFQDGKLDHLGLNGELRDGKFIDASSMPILDLLNLGFIIDRGVPLKFSSPLELGLLEPYSIHRTGIMDPMEEVRKNNVIMSSNERRTWRLYIQEKDELNFMSRFGQMSGNLLGQTCDVAIEIAEGSSVEVIFERSFTSASVMLSFTPVERIDLSRFKGKEIFLTLQSKCLRPDPKIFYILSIVNVRPIQQVGELDDGVSVYFNREALPRAFVVHKAEVVSEDDKLLDKVASAPLASLLTTAYLEREIPGLEDLKKSEPWSGVMDSAERQKEEPGLLTYKVVSNGPGLLFLSDQYYPGWRAFVDGEEKPILRANYNFRAVSVPGGMTTVRFSFEPASFRAGLWASLASIFGCVAAMAGLTHGMNRMRNR